MGMCVMLWFERYDLVGLLTHPGSGVGEAAVVHPGSLQQIGPQGIGYDEEVEERLFVVFVMVRGVVANVRHRAGNHPHIVFALCRLGKGGAVGAHHDQGSLVPAVNVSQLRDAGIEQLPLPGLRKRLAVGLFVEVVEQVAEAGRHRDVGAAYDVVGTLDAGL